VYQTDADVSAQVGVFGLRKRVHDLELILGRKTMEIDVLKEATDPSAPQKPALQLA
jgi:hypothetical protein